MNENTFTDNSGPRQIRECVICGERVTMSNATDEWEQRHLHETGLDFA